MTKLNFYIWNEGSQYFWTGYDQTVINTFGRRTKYRRTQNYELFKPLENVELVKVVKTPNVQNAINLLFFTHSRISVNNRRFIYSPI